MATTDIDAPEDSMSEEKTHLKVVIASPGDVIEERNSLAQVFEDLNRGIASERGFHLDPSSLGDGCFS